MATSTITRTDAKHLKEPAVPRPPKDSQLATMSRRSVLALDAPVMAASIDSLNQLLADTLTIRDMYKKFHWQVSGHTFYMLHQLFDKHSGEQGDLSDIIAERVQTLGGVSIAMAADVAERSSIPRCPREREDSVAQITRLLHAHEIILLEARAMARDCATAGDVGSNDLIVSDIIRLHELQVWFLFEHLDLPERVT
jgi:starvation-inducible DNA-binding protein